MTSSSWSNAYKYSTDKGQAFFVKEARDQDATMFTGEALGLQAMYGRTCTVLLGCPCLAQIYKYCQQHLDLYAEVGV